MIGPWKLLLFTALYSLVSWKLFIETSGGWEALFYAVFGGMFFFTFSILCIGTILFNSKKRAITFYYLDKGLLTLLLIVQILYLLINQGGCGDNPGSYTFIERFFKGADYFCSRGITFSFPLSPYLFLLMFVAYSVVLFYLFGKTLLRKSDKST